MCTIANRTAAELFAERNLLDITQQKEAEEDLRRRDAILGAVGSVAQRFLKAASWEDASIEALGQIGAATEVSRVYIYENMPAGEHLAATSRSERDTMKK